MLYIGTSGFQYAHWNGGVFYPPTVTDFLAYYTNVFNTVEINASFYRTPKPEVVERWAKKLSAGSKLVLKAPRSISHTRRLKLFSDFSTNGIELLDYFVEGVRTIPKEKLGPVLLQIHPRMQINLDRLNIVLGYFSDFHIKVAFEVRHESWLDGDTYDVLRKYNACMVASDWKECPTAVIDTADFVYIRRHGPFRYYGDYSDEDLAQDADMIRPLLQAGRDVFVFFNNDGGGSAPRDGLRLSSLLSETSV